MSLPGSPRDVSLVIEDETVHLTVAHDGEWVVRDHRAVGQECRLRLSPLEPGVYLLQTGGSSCLVHVAEVDERRMLHVGGRTLEYRVEPGLPGDRTGTEPGRPARRGGRAGSAAPQAVGPAGSGLAGRPADSGLAGSHAGSGLAGSHAGSGLARPPAGSEDLSAPMPGVVARVLVDEGEMVTPGQGLVIVEAMKMEHVVRAGRAGVVRRLYVRQGEQVEGGARIAEIGPGPTGPGAT
jgi:biotin carboxyl carrier protein